MSDASKPSKAAAGASTGTRKLSQQIAMQTFFLAQQNPEFSVDLFAILIKNRLGDAVVSMVTYGLQGVLFQATYTEDQAAALEASIQSVLQRAQYEMFQKQFAAAQKGETTGQNFGGMFGGMGMMGGFNPMMMGGMFPGGENAGGFNPMMMGMGGFNPMGGFPGMGFGFPTAPGGQS